MNLKLWKKLKIRPWKINQKNRVNARKTVFPAQRRGPKKPRESGENPFFFLLIPLKNSKILKQFLPFLTPESRIFLTFSNTGVNYCSLLWHSSHSFPHWVRLLCWSSNPMTLKFCTETSPLIGTGKATSPPPKEGPSVGGQSSLIKGIC
jgi:hypothetical protein